jgi:hypothetical protein
VDDSKADTDTDVSANGERRNFSILKLFLGTLTVIITAIILSRLFLTSKYYSPKQRFTSLPPGANLTYRYGPVAEKDFVPMNKTFGFEKIYVLNMPSRTDKKAEMTIVSHQLGIPFEFVDGVDGVALKPGENHIVAGIWGCAEGHAKVWQKMLEDRVSSAVVFEDDVDFDLRIHEQLARMQGE